MPPEKSHFMFKVREICRGEGGNLYWDGTLEEFVYAWKEKFLFHPASERENEFIRGTLYLTPFGTFSAR